MVSMSADEVVIFVAAVALGPLALLLRVFQLANIARVRIASYDVRALAAVVVACGILILIALRVAASSDVRDAPLYLALYVALGLAWLRLAEPLFIVAGLSIRDDVVERRNPAALPAVVGGLVGMSCLYAGANIGNGPGWWVVVFCAALATGIWLLVWVLLAVLSGADEHVTIERDPASGLRLGGFLAATGLVLGRAVAGDWVSVSATVDDALRAAWPVLPLLVLAVFLERRMRPTVTRPLPDSVMAGVVPAAVYVGAALVYLIAPGWPA